MLEIRNLHVTVEGREILNGIDLIVRPGEVHAIMGPNGSGKSTLANVIAGREGYIVSEGEVRFEGGIISGISKSGSFPPDFVISFSTHAITYSVKFLHLSFSMRSAAASSSLG